MSRMGWHVARESRTPRPPPWWGYCSRMGKRRSVVIDGEVVPNLRERENSDGTTCYDVTRTEYRKLKARTAREAKEEMMLLRQAEADVLVERVREVVREELKAWNRDRKFELGDLVLEDASERHVTSVLEPVDDASPVLEHAHHAMLSAAERKYPCELDPPAPPPNKELDRVREAFLRAQEGR
jgi:hypothetical protein